jgi:hypothetical protein
MRTLLNRSAASFIPSSTPTEGLLSADQLSALFDRLKTVPADTDPSTIYKAFGITDASMSDLRRWVNSPSVDKDRTKVEVNEQGEETLKMLVSARLKVELRRVGRNRVVDMAFHRQFASRPFGSTESRPPRHTAPLRADDCNNDTLFTFGHGPAIDDLAVGADSTSGFPRSLQAVSIRSAWRLCTSLLHGGFSCFLPQFDESRAVTTLGIHNADSSSGPRGMAGA